MNNVLRPPLKNITGVLLLDKPIGCSSNAALQKVKRLFQAKKAGHTGSLDPIATGMLPICFGEATKLSQFVLESDKAYYVTVKLGERTPTGDREGDVIETSPYHHVNAAALQEAMRGLTGVISQVPPMYSALKHKGQPLYVLARQGIEVARSCRSITIYEFTLLDFSPDVFTCYVRCSKGTYIRTLIEDCASALNTFAHVLELRRDYVDPYKEKKMYTVDELERMQQANEGLQSLLLPMASMVGAYPVVTLSEATSFYFRMGQAVRTPFDCHGASRVQVITENGQFLGIATITPDGRIQPERLMINSCS